MAEIMLTEQQLVAKKDELRQLNESFKQQVEALVTAEGGLMSMYEGDAKQAFDQAFKNDKNQMDVFYSTMNQYIAALEQIIANYQAAEAQNVATATSRTY